MARSIPLTVIGGYLGAGKTTLVNQLLRRAGGTRIGVIVNDFGSLAIDADLLAGAADGEVVSLVNGCICCTAGEGLYSALTRLAERADVLDHVVIEASGVADPAATAAWARVDPFEPAGVIVLAAADSVIGQAADRYVGDEVRRQLAGADLIVVTKVDAVDAAAQERLDTWLDERASSVPRVTAVHGDIATEIVLGVVPAGPGGPPRHTAQHDVAAHAREYASWTWTTTHPMSRARLDDLLAALPDGLLRVKGHVMLDDGSTVSVQVVGRRAAVTSTGARRSDSGLVAIAPPAVVAVLDELVAASDIGGGVGERAEVYS